MTETSPVSIQTAPDDPLEKRVNTIGRLLPHTRAKIVDPSTGKVVPVGVRGELCVSGYLVMKNYWENPEKTAEILKTDENQVKWIYSGDEAVLDRDGYFAITGRIKDLIIRGGENIAPLEIEDRLMAHDAIVQASCVGIKDERYGEVVAAFVEIHPSKQVSNDDIRDWVRQTLAHYKVPKHIFRLSENGLPKDFPKTGSGKIRKVELRDLGNQLVAKGWTS